MGLAIVSLSALAGRGEERAAMRPKNTGPKHNEAITREECADSRRTTMLAPGLALFAEPAPAGRPSL